MLPTVRKVVPIKRDHERQNGAGREATSRQPLTPTSLFSSPLPGMVCIRISFFHRYHHMIIRIKKIMLLVFQKFINVNIIRRREEEQPIWNRMVLRSSCLLIKIPFMIDHAIRKRNGFWA